MATAGHCPNHLSYYWFTGNGPFSMGYARPSYSGYADLQWHTTSAQPIEPIFHASPTSARPQQGKGQGAVGQFLCHFGQTSGYSCATVRTITYKPYNTDMCGFASSCKPVYSRTSECTSAGGDSGGPWFYGNTPHGVHSGHHNGECIFTRVWYLNQLDLTLLQG